MARLRAAGRRGLPLSWEVTPHHLALTDEDVPAGDARYKVNPPLRSARDREALIRAVLEEPSAVLATDHAPHTDAAKGRGFLTAASGVTGLETALGVTHSVLVERAGLSVMEWVRRWTVNPASVLRRPPPSLAVGSAGDVVLMDLARPWVYRAASGLSKSRNSPFDGSTFQARAVRTVRGGITTWRAPGPAGRLATA
jgi:dihydroorotase